MAGGGAKYARAWRFSARPCTPFGLLRRVGLGRNLLFTSLEESLDVLLKEGKVFLKNAPHELQVNAEVLMNQDITHGGDLFPGDLGG